MTDELLTILFTDVEGSTALHTAKGDAEARRILGACDEVIRQQVRLHCGREIKSTGDGFMIAFTSPRKAVACALAIQEAATRGQPVRVRAGLHTGEVTEEGGDLFGGAVNAAARICAKAQGGQVLVSDVVRQLCGTGELAFTERGVVKLRGFPERWRLHEAVARSLGVRAGERTPFVGREAELAELRGLVQHAVAGRGGIVMIGGEPGVGKSRLAEVICAEARRRCRVFIGHCYEREGDPPYMPWVEMIESVAREVGPAALRAALGDGAAEFARLVPQLRRLLPDLPPPLELPADQQRQYTFATVRDYVTRVSRERPRLYIIEDLHWADESTLLLLQGLAERLPEIACLVLCTYRDSRADIGPRLADALSMLLRRRLARLMMLRPHSQPEMDAFLRGLAGQEPPPAAARAIWSQTQGNAFFVEEVFQHLAESGRLLDERGRFRADLRIDELDVPVNIQLVIGQRIARLQEETRRVLATAAVIGRVFDVDLVEAVEDNHSETVLEALEEAERVGLVTSAPESGGAHDFGFGHELVRQTLLTNLSAPRLRRLHVRVADAMEDLYASRLDEHAAAIAHHLLLAEGAADRSRTFSRLLSAGRAAMAAAAYEEALRHYERASDLADAAEPADRAALLFELGTARRSAGRWDAALDAWRRSLDAFHEVGDGEAAGRVCVAATYNLAWAARWSEAMDMAERGLAALSDRVCPERSRLLAMAALPAAFGGQGAIATQMVEASLSLAAELRDDVLVGHALMSRSMAHVAYIEYPEAVSDGLRAAELLRAAGDLWSATSGLGMVLDALRYLGRLDEACTLHDEIAPIAEKLGNHGALLMCGRTAGMVDFFRTGDLDRLEEFADRDHRLCESVGWTHWSSNSLAWRGLALVLGGKWEEARPLLEDAQQCEVSSVANGWSAAALFECLAYLGDSRAALALLEARELPQPGDRKSSGGAAMLVAAVEGLTALGEYDRAAALYPSVVDCGVRTRVVLPGWIDGRLLERAAGIAAMAGRRFDEAEPHFTRALAQAREIPHRPEQAHTCRWYGSMLLERAAGDDSERAGVLLGQAINDYRRMGMPRHQAMVQELLEWTGARA